MGSIAFSRLTCRISSVTKGSRPFILSPFAEYKRSCSSAPAFVRIGSAWLPASAPGGYNRASLPRAAAAHARAPRRSVVVEVAGDSNATDADVVERRRSGGEGRARRPRQAGRRIPGHAIDGDPRSVLRTGRAGAVVPQ